jgi:predicted AlkP superfamily phosphohydrolase/phosphomutase
MAIEVPERGRPDTTVIGVPNRHRRYVCRSAPGTTLIIAKIVFAAVAITFAQAAPADAYIGPGAGFVLVSSFFAFFITVLIALFSLAAWPVRMIWRLVRRRSAGKSSVRRLVIVGFDGQDPKLTDEYLRAGKLPNFQALANRGGYSRLRTTFPSISPVAWSSFSTGTNPARHNIFDFIDRDTRTYLPVLSSAKIGAPREWSIGRFRIPIGRPDIKLLKRSRPFWSVLGDHGIWSTILRVPISFPPDRFHGAMLSAMSVPDVRGTQGTFTLFSTRSADPSHGGQGLRIHVDVVDDRIDTSLPGPDSPVLRERTPLEVPLRLRIDRRASRVHVDLDGQQHSLEPGRMTDWIPITFRAAPGVSVRGICRLLLTELGDHVSLYVTPINLDPDRPALPISHPSFYATSLSHRVGRFATLGLAEDTSALNEGVIGDADFLQQAYDIDAEREAMLLAGLDRLRSGTLVCVFDATDRIQHMFWRQLGEGCPIEKLYRHNDAMVGRILERLGPDDVLMVLSDHGFAPFRRGVNLNGWLREHGYLVLKPGADGAADWLRDVDWSHTRAYALGLNGLFLNLEGREGGGIVKPAEVPALKAEIIAALNGLVDQESNDVAITEVFDTATIYSGPYLVNAPDFIVGYNTGYRHSWGSATGVIAGPVFADNNKAWSGDHCIDPRLVPGVLFCNRPIDADDPALVDIAPTALHLFGIQPPRYMEGQSIFRRDPAIGVAS